ncbi:nephrin-like isoform X2 [Tachypleus tridentatus]|uniref:nephrin-like isoform X2 n=1 Tax=Tachypleus tridentatus TaxID=6853 RepID=UPI003FD1B450
MTFKSRLVLVSTLLLSIVIFGQKFQQHFRVEPHNQEVIEGQKAVLRCEVEQQAGAVQWSKDGFVLGFDRAIPGYVRYSMAGNPDEGVHNLHIKNARLEDDGEYQCQVGPTPDNHAIRANARLTVLVPPTSVVISDYENGSVVEIHQLQSLSLTCTVIGGKPAAHIKWFRKNVQLRPDNVETKTKEGKKQKFNTVSTINLTPNPDDNGAIYTCQAIHRALVKPLRSSIILSVLFPPGPPAIDGFQAGQAVRSGDTITLTCVSRGGNPLAQLIWYKNNQQVDFSYTTSGRKSTNKHTFVVDTSDNNAIYRCEASNIISPQPMNAVVKLSVLFASSEVKVSGPKETKPGESVTMSCATSRSNPAAEINWLVDGQRVKGTNVISADPNGGWTTKSNITVIIKLQERQSRIFQCFAVNKELGETKVESHVLSILYPPNPPTILGFTKGKSVRAGERQQITCTSSGGNPLPTLKWFRGDEEVKSVTTTSGNVVSSEVTIATKESDNGVEIRCEASNSASTKPLISTIKLTVHFPPSGVTIKVKPPKQKAGGKVNLICESASSNPASVITWWRNGFLLQGSPSGVFDAPHGGKSTRNLLQLNVTSEDNGSRYTCQAMNEVLERSVHSTVTLNITYKPKFYTLEKEIYDIVERDSTFINLTARGNPNFITYNWVKDGKPIVDIQVDTELNNFKCSGVCSQGPILRITNVTRTDSGRYKCEATNDEGASETTIILNVLYSATISKVTQVTMVEQNTNAYLECVAGANPITDSMIFWRRFDFDMNRTKQYLEDGHSFLTIYNVSQEDSGAFECVADNGIGPKHLKKSYLVVKHKPIIHNSSPLLKSASEKGETAKIICRANGAPNVTFTWSHEGATVSGSVKPGKYFTGVSKIDLITWESILYVKDVKNHDYGVYECVARNDLGFDSIKIVLNSTSQPDPPVNMKVLNVDHNTATLQWSPGFDGGLPQAYRIRYKESGYKAYQYADVYPPNATAYNLTGLGADMEYTFSIQAFNELGSSEFTTDVVIVKTSNEVPGAETEKGLTKVLSEKGKLPRIIIVSVSIVGTFLLALNIVLVICFVRRRRKKRLEEEESDQTSSKAATIEMYAPSSYNDTVNGETMSSISEKSESYSDGPSTGEYSEEPDKPVLAKYLLDQNRDSYIPDGTSPQSSPYGRYPPEGSMQSSLDRQPELSHRHLYETEEELYVDALRRNAFNQKLGEKVSYGRIEYNSPPLPPSRTAASGGEIYNVTADARYVPFTVSRTANNMPVLSTFNPNIPGPNPGIYRDQIPDGITIEEEMPGHLV